MNGEGKKMRFVWGVVLALSATPIAAQEWFVHPFGELRAYHQDWLAVCQDEGAGPCRIVRAQPDANSSSAFDQRMSVHRGADGWWIEVMDRGMVGEEVTSLTFKFGSKSITVPAEEWSVGERGARNVTETLTLNDAQATQRILERMRAGLELDVLYAPSGNGDGRATFPLRGVVAAMGAIEEIEAKR